MGGMVSSGSVPKRSRVKAWFLVVVVVLLSVVGSVSYLGWRQSVSGVVSRTVPPRFVGHKTALVFTLEATRGNIARVEIRVGQTGSSAVVATREGPLGPRVDVPVVLEGATLGLREGGASLEVWARDDFWRPLRMKERAIASYPVTVDLTPPRIELLGATRYVAAGGSGLVAFRVTGASRTTVSAGKLVEPSFPWGPPERGARVALVAFPWDLAPGALLSITAEDEAGNVASRALPSELRSRRFPRDRIEIKDAFLQAKVPELLPQRAPSQPLVDGFLVINRELRRQAEETKRRIGASSADAPLWEGPLMQPSRTKVFANFAEARTYLYGGREIDKQVHYGYDLASTRQSSVPAANRGAVVFAGPLTIYGNTVIVDHGLGLQTLYAHLSSIEVKVGDTVAKGQELGRTGATGLAMGDHLHFEVLVNGVSVTPLEWWDARWIRDHITKPLRDAGLPEIGGAEARAEAPAGRSPARNAARRR
jgi:murein DD-endopeptidase MepM/ murein hydrolase activator NlpD